MNRLFATFALTVVIPCIALSARADTVTASPPAGYFKLTARGASDSWLSAPLAPRSVALGRVASLGANSLTLDLVTAPADHAYQPTASAVYYAQFISGNLEGLCYAITDSQGATLSLDTLGETLTAHPLGSVVVGGAGDRVRIRTAWTVADLLGRTGDDLLLDPVTALASTIYESGDAVLLPDNNALGLEKSPAATLAFVTGAGWRKRGEPTLDAGNTPLLPGVPFIVRRQAAEPVTSYLIGYVSQERAVVRLPALNADEERDVPFVWIPADGIALPNSSLSSVILPWANATEAGDEVLAYSTQRPGFALPPEYRWHFTGSSWFDRSLAAVDSRLDAGTGYILRLRGARGVGYWLQPSGL